MHILVRRLPAATSRLDLRRFISAALQPRWHHLEFGPIGRLTHCDIFQVRDADTPHWEYHGLIQVEPAKAATVVIERANGQYLHSKPMEVRKFYCRSAARDPRKTRDAPPLPIQEQRQQDRRRPHLQFEQLHAGTTSRGLSGVTV